MKNSKSFSIILLLSFSFVNVNALADATENKTISARKAAADPGQQTENVVPLNEHSGNQLSNSDKKSKLNLSLEQLSSDEQVSVSGNALLTDKERQLMENLKPQTDNSTSFVAAKKNEEGVSMSGSMLTEGAELDSGPSLQAGKNYVDSIDGAKVDLGVKF